MGDVCHIKAASPKGPRYDTTQTAADRHGFDNLILLCKPHHKVIDDDEESYPVERLTKMKAQHETGAEPVGAREADDAAQLLINQMVVSTNQSGGIAAHTVNAGTINFHAPTPIPHGAGTPDWTITELFRHLRPNLDITGSTEAWDEVGGEVFDKLTTGQMTAWGRRVSRGATTTYSSLVPIDPLYWQFAVFTYAFLLDDHERDTHVRHQSGNPDYADLHFNRDSAIEIWPHSLLAQWVVPTIQLDAQYFGGAPDQLTMGCKSVSVFDARIDTISQGPGLSTYQQMVEQAFLLVTGVDTKTLDSLAWKPTRALFTDPSGANQEFYLSQRIDNSRQGRAKLFLENQPTITPQPISSAIIDRANATFGDRINRILIGMDAPAALRHGPTLILHAIPTSAFAGREIGRSEPKMLGPCFKPDGHERIIDRPRQDGWLWHEPPEKISNLLNPVVRWFSSLDWNGLAEIVLNLNEFEEGDRPVHLSGYPLERYIVKTFDSIADGYEKLNLRAPVIVRVTLNHVLGSKLVKSTSGSSLGFERPMFISEAIGVSSMTRPLGSKLKPILDSLWRAAGWADGSTSFARGDWDGYQSPFPYQ